MLGEMKVQPRCLDVTEQLVLSDPLTVSNSGDDMRVAERGLSGDDRERSASLEMHLAGRDGVYRCPVWSGDVDPEVERPRRPSDARIVERPTHGVRPTERS